MVKIGKDFSFEAAHRLQNHGGKCRNLHGHSYRVFVGVGGGYLQTNGPSEGMLLDFSLLSKWWKTIEPKLDHQVLLQENDPLAAVLQELNRAKPDAGTSLNLFQWPPTAEHLAGWLHEDLSDYLDRLYNEGDLPEFYTVTVRVYETATSWAEV